MQKKIKILNLSYVADERVTQESTESANCELRRVFPRASPLPVLVLSTSVHSREPSLPPKPRVVPARCPSPPALEEGRRGSPGPAL